MIEERGRQLDALVAQKVLGCKVVWRKPERKDWEDRCSDHAGGNEPECRCVDPWEGPGIPIKCHAHFGPAHHDQDETERCRAIPHFSGELEMMVELLQQRWTDIAIESSGLNWTVTTPITSITDTDLKLALCLAAVESEEPKKP